MGLLLDYFLINLLSCPLISLCKFSLCLKSKSNDNIRKSKKIVQTGDSFLIQGKKRNKNGRNESMQIPDRLEILFQEKTPAQIIADRTPIGKFKIVKTPNNHEIPFTPLKFRKTEKT